MTRPHRPVLRWPLVGALLAAAVFAAAGRAQVDPLMIPDDDEPEVNPQQNQVFMVNEANFNQWVFNGRDVASIKDRFASHLSLKIEELERSCSLTSAQKKKLELAGRGDVKRFFDQVDAKRKKFTTGQHDQNQWNQLWQEIQPLQLAMRSEPFADGTFFAKTVKTALDSEQAEKYEKVLHEKMLFRYRAKLLLVVAQLDQAVGFKADQRERLLKMLQDETQPPLKFGQYDYQVVMLQAARIPEAKLKPLFNDDQWRVLHRRLEQSKGMEPFLINAGVLPVDPTAKPAVGRRKKTND